jgi:hypothetical protein
VVCFAVCRWIQGRDPTSGFWCGVLKNRLNVGSLSDVVSSSESVYHKIRRKSDVEWFVDEDLEGGGLAYRNVLSGHSSGGTEEIH